MPTINIWNLKTIKTYNKGDNYTTINNILVQVKQPKIQKMI